jgi:hypothetical protein
VDRAGRFRFAASVDPQRSDRVLALPAHLERFAAGDQNRQSRRAREEGNDLGSGVDHVLDVVD